MEKIIGTLNKTRLETTGVSMRNRFLCAKETTFRLIVAVVLRSV